jgi:signal transduction histidine kinase/ActR/RegA family two-component response regulator
MTGRRTNQRYLLWLALGTATMAIAMAALLAFELAQKRTIEQSSSLRSDSLTALVFQFEREFLRFRQTLDKEVGASAPIDAQNLTLRYDLFLSRVALLRESPGLSVLDSRPEYQELLPRLEELVRRSDAAMGASPLDRDALAELLDQYNALGASVQAVSHAADSEVARLLERQSTTMLDQNDLIVALTSAQLLLLLGASAALALRHRRQEKERLALEKLTEDLLEARIQAEAANRGKSQFLANMSHELRTPFNGMMGMLGLLEATPISAEQADYIKTAQRSAHHLLTLLNDILDVSALEAGKVTLKPLPLDLRRLLMDVEALMQPHATAKGLDFSLVHVQSSDVSARWVMADETRLKQILFNLINNAIKFTEDGEIKVTVAQTRESDQSVRLAIAVRDTGIGMDVQGMAQLFQRFYQVDGSATRRFGGTGLGLEISQSLANMMGGAITVTSELGEGSEFTLSVPLAVGEPPPPSAPTNPSALALVPTVTQADAASSSVVANAPRVLVVEDHPINQKLVGVLLQRMGCSVAFCENGQLALDRVAQEPFDLILMDVSMPVMDGLTATRAIRVMEGPMAATPIVVLTADVMNEAVQTARDAGANDFLGKPVAVDQLRAVVAKHLKS